MKKRSIKGADAYMEPVAEYLNNDDEYYSDRFLVEAFVLSEIPEIPSFSEFEKNAGFKPLEENPVPLKTIYRKTDAEDTGVIPMGQSLWQQSYSLLPKHFFIGEDFPARVAKEAGKENLPHPEILLRDLGHYTEALGEDMTSFQKLTDDIQKKDYHNLIQKEMQSELHLRHGLTYVLARHIMGYFPRTISWIDEIHSLDPFTATLFALLTLARGSSQKLRWISALHDQAGIFQPLTLISQTIPRLEGAPVTREKIPYRRVLQNLTATICLMDSEIVKVCVRMANIGTIPKMPTRLIQDALGVSARTARYKARLMERGIREHFIPNISMLDWRYRYILTTNRTVTTLSRNVVEKRLLLDSEYHSLETHIEPRGIQEPRFRKTVAFHTSIETESVSFQLDLFDPNQRAWRIEPWKSEGASKPIGHDKWLYVSTKPSGEIVTLSPTMQELIMFLLANEGSPQDKYTIMEMMGHSTSTDRQYLPLLMEQGILSLLHYPQPAFSLLPDELLILIRNTGRDEIDYISDMLNSTMPLVHARYDDIGRSAIYQIRLPLHTAAIVKEFFENRLDHVDAIIEVVSERKNYFLSVFQKGYNIEENRWSNPWK